MIVDGYSGAGGWDEGARLAGVGPVVGIDNWFDACRTGMAAGHARICADVSTYATAPFVGKAEGLLMSPPCQAWSMAGKRLGEADRRRVHELVDRIAAGHDDWWNWPWADHRSHHTAQPVRWVRDLRPEFVCLEQVPEVLPLWKHMGRVFAGWGYSVWAGKLCAADYGVPQTRTRAFLIASRVRNVAPPLATHYDPRRGVAMFGTPWVSMAEALGWSGASLVRDRGAGMAERHGPRTPRRMAEPSPTITAGVGGSGARMSWSLTNSQDNATTRGIHEPAGTVFCSRPGNLRWVTSRPATTVAGDPRISPPGHRDREGGERQHAESLRVTVAEAATLQSFRPDYPWQGNKTSQFLQVGNAVPPAIAAAVIRVAAGVSTPVLEMAA